MATATDDFNRSAVLTTPWTNQAISFTCNGTQAAPTDLNNDSASVYNGSPLGSVGADQYVQVVMGTLTGGNVNGGDGIGVCARWATGAMTGYRLVVNAAATLNVEIARFNAGAKTGFPTFTQAFASGDVLRLEVTGQNASTVLLIKRAAAASPTSFSTIQTVNDTTGSQVNSGFPGLAYSSTLSVALVDNWEGGDISVGGAALTPNVNESLAIGDQRFIPD